MGNIVKMAKAVAHSETIAQGEQLQKKPGSRVAGFDGDAFGAAVAEVVRNFVTREVGKLRSEFDVRVKLLEERGTLEYLGVFEPERQYTRGNFASHNGSLWHCNCATRQRPGDGPDWTLAVKKGRDAK